MSAKTAAPVITKMSDAEALRILTSLKPDTVASIYEKMTTRRCCQVYRINDETVILSILKGGETNVNIAMSVNTNS